MKKLHYIIWGKYRKHEKPKISKILEKTLVLSIVCREERMKIKTIFREEGSIGLIESI